MTSIRAIIVDDEPLARNRLKRLLKDVEDVDIVGEGKNGEEGLRLIETLKPELIFLDIKMPLLTGFEMLEKLDVSPSVVFTTAFDAYALRAFEENTVDYLLKPISEEKLERALNKVRKIGGGGASQTVPYKRLIDALTREDRIIRRFSVRIGDRILIVPEEKICFFRSEDKYTFLHTVDEKYIISFSLKELQKRIDPDQFIRIHRGVIIRLDEAESIHKWFRGQLKIRMKQGQEFTVTSRYVGAFKEKIHL